MSRRSRRRLFFTLLSALILALSSMTAVFAGGPPERSDPPGQQQAQDDRGDHCEDSDSKGHEDCKPGGNNPTPSNPPCDADHGHPAEDSPRCQDRDGDGVPDDRDACPDEPGPAENDGCPEECPDRDDDGVCDEDDQCPDEPGPEENDGCPEEVGTTDLCTAEAGDPGLRSSRTR